MKITNILLATAISFTISFAGIAENINTKAMAGMEGGLNNIQKSFSLQ